MRKLCCVKVTGIGSPASIWTTSISRIHRMTLIDFSTKPSKRSSSIREYPTYQPARPISLSSDREIKNSGKKSKRKIGSSSP